MKKDLMYTSLSAMILVGALGFTACSSGDEIAEDLNPTYDAAKGTVKAQFAIGITSKANAVTRMTEATVQAQSTPLFRGMQDVVLIPFDRTPADATNRIGAYIIPGEGKIKGDEVSVTDAAHALQSTANYVVYSDVEVPVGTTHFLFYGHAPADDFTKGRLTASDAYPIGGVSNANFVDPKTSLSFTPTSILAGKDDQVAGGNSKGQALIALLNAVANASADVTIGSTTTTGKKWSTVTAEENLPLCQLYAGFITLTSGSSFNVHRSLQDLYYSVNNLAQTTDNPYSAIAGAIQTAILAEGNNTASADAKTLTFADSYLDYPETVLSIPEGAAKISWNGTAFVDAIQNNASSGGDNIGVATGATVYSTYAYPADLWYWKNTAIHASNQVESVTFGDKEWDGEGSIIETEYAGDPTVVSGSTKSVALDGPVNYAVAQLDLSINVLSGSFIDSRMNAMDFTKTKSEDPVHGFKDAVTLTGVLVGYQQQVNWQFVPVTGKEYVIYDKTIPDGAAVALNTLTATGKNYTLVLQTPKDEPVNIALQFKNDGPDFYGKGGELIPSGGTFYLSGALDPKAETGVEGYTDGSKDKVFIQDYVTTVALDIKNGNSADGSPTDPSNPADGIADSQEGFQAATNTIPDLRIPQLELCFSVDLSWNQGLTFTPTW